jgi:hypothetical protein
MYCLALRGRLSLVAAAGLLLSSPLAREARAVEDEEEVAVVAVEEEDEGPNQGRLSLTLNNDFTTAYFFRGILNERKGLIWQPSLDLSLNVYAGDGALESVDLGFGIWASYQSEDTLAEGAGPESLYEVDYYPSITLAWAGGIETSLIYYFYTSPNGAFNTVEQLDLELAYDDSELLGAFALNPTATFSFETKNTSFGDKEGGYFELAGAPGLEIALPGDESGSYPLGVSFPVVLGLSMYDYYEEDGDEDTFGYVTLGVDAGVPLAFIPEDFGSWSATLGLDVFFLSDRLEDVNEDDNPYPVFTASVTMDY